MARLTTSSDARILITVLVMARRNIFEDTSSLEVVMASEADATKVLAGSDGTSEAAVIVVDEEGFDLASVIPLEPVRGCDEREPRTLGRNLEGSDEEEHVQRRQLADVQAEAALETFVDRELLVPGELLVACERWVADHGIRSFTHLVQQKVSGVEFELGHAA